MFDSVRRLLKGTDYYNRWSGLKYRWHKFEGGNFLKRCVGNQVKQTSLHFC